MRRNISSAHIFFYLFIFEWTVLNSGAYKTYSLYDANLCVPTKKMSLPLDEKEASAALVNYTNIHHGIARYDYYNLKCTFKVYPSLWLPFMATFKKYRRIIAVVQQMALRKNATTGKCIDFVQFRTNGVESPQYCGRMKASETMAASDGARRYDRAPFTFVGESITVTVRVGEKSPDDEERIGFSIAFTRTEDCSREGYSRCKGFSDELCIRFEYFKDGVLNCPYYDCADEHGCPAEEKTPDPLGFATILTGVGSLVGSFVLFVACVFTCHRCFKYGRRRRPNDRVPATPNESPTAPESPTSSTFPVLVPEREEDKPPPYSSLFPDRSPR